MMIRAPTTANPEAFVTRIFGQRLANLFQLPAKFSRIHHCAAGRQNLPRPAALK
jgi:hypothetical protein